MPIVVFARRTRTWQKFHGIPYRRYIELEIVGRDVEGWTQALSRKDVPRMALDWLKIDDADIEGGVLVIWS